MRMRLTKGEGYRISNICKKFFFTAPAFYDGVPAGEMEHISIIYSASRFEEVMLIGKPARSYREIETGAHMNDANRSIFRKEAIEKYIREQENKVLLKFVSPRLFLFIWAVFAVLSGLGVWLCFAEVPLFVSGRGMIVDQEELDSGKGSETCVVAFFPPDIHSRLVAGKSLMIRTKDPGRSPHQTIVILESEVLSPADMRKKFHPKTGETPVPTQTSAVAVCRLNDQNREKGIDMLSEYAFEVRLRAGTRRIASFLPVLDRFFSQSARP